MMNNKLKKFFQQSLDFLETQIAPISNELDYDANLLQQAYLQLKEMGCLQLLIPTEYGGFGGERLDWIDYNIQMAMYSGALLFLQAQHQSAVVTLKKLLPQNGVKNILRHFIEKDRGVGISLAAKRKILTAKSTKDGFLLSGNLPWITGFNYFDEILLSFDLDGVVYYTLLPLQDSSIQISFLKTAVFESANNVAMDLNNVFIPTKKIIAVDTNQLKKINEHPAVYNFAGAAKALLTISEQGKYFDRPSSKIVYDSLLNEWEIYYKNLINESIFPLELRAIGFQLANKCEKYARIVCGSHGILVSHPLTRISREIWQYAVAGYSADQVDAYLKEIPAFAGMTI